MFKSVNYFVIQGDPRWAVGDLALGKASDLLSQAPKKRFFALFLFGRVEISMLFVQSVCEEMALI
jgi:hypothetical protein